MTRLFLCLLPHRERDELRSTILISQSPEDVQRILEPARGAEAQEIERSAVEEAAVS